MFFQDFLFIFSSQPQAALKPRRGRSCAGGTFFLGGEHICEGRSPCEPLGELPCGSGLFFCLCLFFIFLKKTHFIYLFFFSRVCFFAGSNFFHVCFFVSLYLCSLLGLEFVDIRRDIALNYDKNRAGYDKNRAGYDKNRAGYDKNRAGYDKNRAGYDKT